MADLTVTPGYLDNLATKQEAATSSAGEAAAAVSNMAWDLWWTHGVISTFSNNAVIDAQTARATAGNAIQQVSLLLSTRLSTAGGSYKSIDEETGQSIDKQVLDG